MRSGPAGQCWQQQAGHSDASGAVNHPRLCRCQVTLWWFVTLGKWFVQARCSKCSSASAVKGSRLTYFRTQQGGNNPGLVCKAGLEENSSILKGLNVLFIFHPKSSSRWTQASERHDQISGL